MKVRAVIFDVYSTLLDVGPPPPDAEFRWRRLFRDVLQSQPRMSAQEFSVAGSRLIATRHAWARARGIPWPEIQWPSVVMELLPELARVDGARWTEFVYQQLQTGRTLRMLPETASTLRWLQQQGTLLGIASNAQAYTLRELDEALRGHALSRELWEPDLCFWSYRHGFSKPDPHVFQLLTARLETRGIAPGETLMVGDRLDNDVEPARAFGWRTWHLAAAGAGLTAGPWTALSEYLLQESSGAL